MDQHEFDAEVVRRFRAGEPLEQVHREGILLLTTTGRRSGAPRTSPMMFVMDGTDPVVVASNVGAPHHPAWFLNLADDPAVVVETPDGGSAPARAEELEGGERERVWRSLVEQAPFFTEHQQRAGDRRIPLVRLRRDTA